MKKISFGKTADGTPADLFVLSNENGFEAAITNYGATLVSLKTPDRAGNFADVIAGYDDVAGYEAGRAYFGGTVGRYANRIAHGEFSIDGKKYHLAKNNGPNHLHGGDRGFNKRFWSAEDVSSSGQPKLRLRYLSKDGEEGYPGNLSASVTYSLAENELKIEFEATTDQATVVNLTNHTYFNLAGAGDILGHHLTLFASHFIPADAAQIPTGEIRSVAGTPFDFRRETAIGDHINSPDEQLKIGLGYDHTVVVDRSPDQSGSLVLAARAFEPTTGRVLDVSTTQPGVHFYTGNHLDGSERGKGKAYGFRTYFCLEAQHFPNSPNHPNFPSTLLRPGEIRRSLNVYKFSAE